MPLVLRQRENCMLQVPTFLNNPGKTYSPKLSCQVVNVRGCINCVLIIAGSPGSLNPSQSCKLSPLGNVNRKTIALFGAVLDHLDSGCGGPEECAAAVPCGSVVAGNGNTRATLSRMSMRICIRNFYHVTTILHTI